MEPEVRTLVMDLAADGFGVLSSDDGRTHTVLRWEMTARGMSFEPDGIFATLADAWNHVEALRSDALSEVTQRLLD